MDGVAAKINARAPKSRNEMKPKTHHFFYVLVWICGWLAPPLAVVIRFGVGRDFFINIICTICGYFPGHFHNFYCQTIRNNKTAARTPKWAVKYGLVEVRDKRGGKHQWAGRYDERLPDSARNEYGDNSSVASSQQAGGWDGRGPEPSRRQKNGDGAGHHGGLSRLAPWDQAVEPEEVEGGASAAGSARNGSGGGAGRAFDPIDNEQFFASTADTDRPRSVRSKKSKKGLKGLLSHRDRYENQEPASTGDRFDKMNAARGSRPQDEYQDDFERELNSRPAPAAATRYDSFDQEGPEDAWASSRSAGQPSGRNGGNSASQPATTSNGDGDLFKHTF